MIATLVFTLILAAPFSLEDAVNAALKSQPMVRQSEAGIDAAVARIRQESASRLPKVQLSEEVRRGNNPTYVFSSLLEQGRFGPDNFAIASLNQPGAVTNMRSTITTSASIFDGARNNARIEQARESKSQADLRLRQVEHSVRFEVVRAYYGLIVARAAKAVADQAVRTAESNVQRVQDRLRAGLVVDSDLLAAQVELSNLKRQQFQSQSDIVYAEATFNSWMGLPLGTPVQVSGSLLEKTFQIDNQDELIHRAIERRPDYAASSSMVQSSEDRIRETRADFLPSVRAFASLGVSGRNPVSGSSDYIFGANVTYDLFNGERKSRLSEAESARAATKAQQDELARQIRLEVVRAAQQFLTAKQQLDVARSTVEQAQEALRIIQDRYDLGLTTITDLLRAQTELMRTQLSVLSSRQTYIIGYAAVLLATGELTDVRSFS